MGNQGFQGEARAPAQSSIVQEGNAVAISYINATTQVSDNACIIGKPTRRDNGVTRSVTSHLALFGLGADSFCLLELPLFVHVFFKFAA